MLLRQLGARGTISFPPSGLLPRRIPPHPLLPRPPLLLRQQLLPRFASTTAKTPSPTLKRLRNLLLTTALLATLTSGYILATDTRSAIHTYLVPPLLRLLFPGPAGAEPAHAFGIQALSRLYALHTPLHDRSYGVPQSRVPLTPGGTVDWPAVEQSKLADPFGLAITLFGHRLATPLGIPAGLDKHAEAVDALFAVSPAVAVVEVGCVTPKPQPGNPGVRVWRLPGSEGMLNRYGFNSVGAVEVARRLRERVRRFAARHGVTEGAVLDGLMPPGTTAPPLPASLIPGRLLAVQIGKNAGTSPSDLPAVLADYKACVDILGPYADLLVVNVSSPNTPGLRTLQSRAPLTALLTAVVDAADRLPRRVKPKILVKVSPDEDTPEQIRDICAAVRDSGVSGVIVANTTTRRDAGVLLGENGVGGGVGVGGEERRVVREEAGGVSGPALYARMRVLVGGYRRELDGMGLWERFDTDPGVGGKGEGGAVWGTSRRGQGQGVVVVGCGGVRTGEQAVETMRMGAGGVWLYTGMVYGGVGTMGRVAGEMRRIVRGE